MLRTLAANYRLDSIGLQLWSKTSVRKNTNGRAYFQRLHDKPLLYRNIGEQIQRAADIYENEPAFISCHENRTLSFAQAKKAGEDLAIQLSQLGMKPGDHLGIWAPNTTQWYITFMAAALGGFPLICLNYALKAQEMAYQLQKAKVKALVTPDIISKQDYNGILKSLLPNRHKNADFIDDDKFPHLRHVIMQSQTKEDGFIDFDELLGRPVTQEQRRHLNEELVPSIEPEMPCNIQFTSGTTGRPKAALLSHFNHVNMGFICGPNWGIGSGDNASIRICTLVPLFHAFGMGVNMAALHYGGALVSPSPTFNPTAALTAIEKEKCSFICGTPTMYLDMLQMQNKLNKDMSSMQYGVVGGAACTPQVFKSTKEQLGLKYFRIGYGQSECTTCAFLQVGGETPKDSETTIGTLLPHLEAKVIDKQGRIVKYGETGELCIRGFSTMLCYYDDEEKTKETLSSDGWLRTGDDVTLSEEGIARIMGRQKEMIIRGGENIFPKEIEDFLDSHPDILESQVVGVPDERMGEEVCVYLRLKSPSKTLTLDDIKLFCKDKIAHFKIPRYLRIVEDYPKTNSGKIQKYKLQEMFTKDK